MRVPLDFVKYEGLGNDFVVVDLVDAVEGPAALDSAAAARICDRRRGVGADGVLLVLPPRDRANVARMKVLNADGSVPEMCGNGLRCVALHVAARGGGDAAECGRRAELARAHGEAAGGRQPGRVPRLHQQPGRARRVRQVGIARGSGRAGKATAPLRGRGRAACAARPFGRRASGEGSAAALKCRRTP